MANPDPIVERLSRVRTAVAAAAIEAGRDPSEVRLLLATKTQSADRIRVTLGAGVDLIGENRAQEVVAKADDLSDIPHETHFIGHLQANKINQLLGRISCLQTLDSVELAGKLQSRLEARDDRLDVLIQVNVSGEESKSGVAPDGALDLLAELDQFPRLTVRGFMTVGLNSPDQAEVRSGFRQLAQLRDSARQQHVSGAADVTELSMGMSGDFAAAIAEGATIVRLGSAVFGARARQPVN